MQIGLSNTRIPGMFAAVGPNGEIISQPLNADCVMLAKVVDYVSATSVLTWKSAWSDQAPEYTAKVYMSHRTEDAGEQCKLRVGDMTVVYRAPRSGQVAGPDSVAFTDWYCFVGGQGDASCSPGVTLFASKIILTKHCDDPLNNDYVAIDGDGIMVAKDTQTQQTTFKDILKAETTELQLCNLESGGAVRTVKVLVQPMAVPPSP
jgi:hypothetical protein